MLRKVLFLSVVALAVGIVAGVAMAGNEEVAPMTEATPMIEAPVAAAVNVGNTVCPVTDAKIEKPGENTVEYQGKIYNLCCPMCKDTFLADPAKYVAKVDAEMAKTAAAVPAETK